jgi:hypothetical protein
MDSQHALWDHIHALLVQVHVHVHMHVRHAELLISSPFFDRMKYSTLAVIVTIITEFRSTLK